MPADRGGAFLREGDERGDILRHEPRDRSPIRFPTISLALCLFSTCVSLRDLAGGKTGSKRGDGGMPGSFDKEPAP